MEDLAGGKVLKRKYELGSEYGSVRSWKETIKMRNGKDWEEEVNSKRTLKHYKLVKNGAVMERYLMSVQEPGSCEAVVQTENWLSCVVGG